MKVVQSRKISVMAGALAILIILMNFRIPAALAETWSFVDGNGTTGLNYDVSKAASTPYMVNFGGSLYVTWAESSGTNGQIRVKKYDSDSGTWSTADNDTPLNVNAAKDAQNPTLAVLGGTLYAAWQEAGSPYWQVRVKKLTATGWVSVDGDGAGGLNYNTSNNARNAKLAAYNGSLYLLWDEALGSGITQMRVKKYSGSGSSWGQENGGSALNRSVSNSAQIVSVAVWNNKLIVAWSENKDSSINLHVKAFNGSSWSYIDGNDDNGLNVDASKWAQNSDLATDGTSLYIAWHETSDGQNQIYVKKYDGTSWTLLQGSAPGFGINQSTTTSAYRPRMAVVDGTLFVSWYEGSPSRIRAKKYVDNAWVSVDGNGTGGLNKDSTKAAMNTNLASVSENSVTKLYVVFQETNGTANQLRVKLMGPDNTAPTASAVSFGGTLKVGNTLTGTYTYADAESDAEGATSFKWYTATDAAGTGKTAISGATTSTLALTSAHAGKYIIFEVTPVAAAGTATGTPVSYTSAAAVLDNAAPTASAVSFGGTLKVGNTLTGAYTYADAESDAEGATAFKWYTANDAAGTSKTAISGATTSTLALTSAQVGKYIIFEVTPVAAAGTATGTPVSYTSAAAVLDNAAPTASAVSFSGTLKVGNTLTGAYTYADAEQDAEGATAFKWYTANDAAGTGKTAISGATASTLALTSAQAGKYIIFEVTPVAAAGTATGTPVSYTSAAAVLDNAAPTASAVSFGGTLKVGNTLTGAYTYADAESDAEGATAFKWYTANDAAGTGKTAISGATASTLALTNAQVGKYIIFEVTPVAAAGTTTGTPVSYTSAAAVLDNAAPTASAVSFGGTLKVGNTLTGTYTYADAESDAEGVTAFKWYTANDAAGTDKTAIAGATTSTLALTSAHAGKYIIFEVTPVAAAGTAMGTSVSYTSAAAVLDNAAPTASAVSFGGTLKVGNTLTGAYTYADAEQDAEGATTFKWYTATDAAGTGKTAISGATASTLALTSEQVGKYIIFEVTPVAAAGTTTGTPVSYTSASAVAANAAPVVSNVHITGGIKLGQVLTGSYSYADVEGDAEGLPVFKWYAADDAGGSNKTVIAGASGIKLELKAAQYGKYVSFEVTPTASAGTTPGTPVESEALGPVGVLKGDANGDGIISPADALLVTKYVSGKLTLTDEQKLMLDMDDNGKIDANDAKLILNIYNGKGA